MGFKYKTGGVYNNNKKEIDIVNTYIMFSEHKYFKIKYLDIFENYTPSINNKKEYDNWINNPMQFWQNQLHFAIWCATTGCGVSFHDNLVKGFPLTKSLFYFHIYYQIRRILNELEIPLPQDKSFDAKNNPYNRKAYEKVCNEFNVSPNTK